MGIDSILGAVAGPVIGGLIGGSGGSSPSGSTTTSTAPWSGAQPYLNGAGTPQLDANGKPVLDANGQPVMQAGSQGIFPLAQQQYQAGGWSPTMDATAASHLANINSRANGQVQGFNNLAQTIQSGAYDPNYHPVGAVNSAQMSAAQIAGAPNVNGQAVDPTQAYGSMGAVNPTQSIQQLLSGQVNNKYLDPMAQALTAQSNQNLLQNVMPAIGHDAIASGQYGGSRQGIAQGVAAGNAQTGLDNSIANLYGNAFSQAQGNMNSTANSMAGLGLNNAQSNAARNLQSQSINAANALDAQKYNANALDNASQFNAHAANNMGQFNTNAALQNNTQDAAYRATQLQNQLAGLNTMQAGNALNDQSYGQIQGLLGAGNAYNQNNLKNYASIVSPGAGMGGTTSNPYFTNTAANVLGGAAVGQSLFGKMNWGGNANSGQLATPPAAPSNYDWGTMAQLG